MHLSWIAVLTWYLSMVRASMSCMPCFLASLASAAT